MKGNTMEEKRSRDDTVDIIYGLLSIGIVYLHSNYANGFSIKSFGTDLYIVKQLSSLIFLTFVPIFLILYGYLSYNSFFSSEANSQYLKRKVSRFLPIYVFFLTVSMFRNPTFWGDLSSLKIILGFLGLYYESGITSGHIVFIANMTLITRVLFVKFRLRSNFLFPYLIILVLICNFIIKRPAEFYLLRYFGYYLAVIFGMNLKKIGLLDGSLYKNKMTIALILLSGIVVPVLNLNKIYFVEIMYRPNSIEQILFSGAILLGAYFGLRTILEKIPTFAKSFLRTIGERSYAHFIIHIHVGGAIIYAGKILNLSNIATQWLIILFSSYISVFIVYPAWERASKFIVQRFPFTERA